MKTEFSQRDLCKTIFYHHINHTNIITKLSDIIDNPKISNCNKIRFITFETRLSKIELQKLTLKCLEKLIYVWNDDLLNQIIIRNQLSYFRLYIINKEINTPIENKWFINIIDEDKLPDKQKYAYWAIKAFIGNPKYSLNALAPHYADELIEIFTNKILK